MTLSMKATADFLFCARPRRYLLQGCLASRGKYSGQTCTSTESRRLPLVVCLGNAGAGAEAAAASEDCGKTGLGLVVGTN